MKPFTLHLGDCIAVMRGMEDASVDSIVTDPPYELGFMGKAWDNTGIANNVEMWREALRVLKPGGHLLAFSGSRTYHRMTCAIEDAGFEVRDQIMYIYGSGFPKSHNLDNLRGKNICGCTTGTMPYDHKRTVSEAECNLRSVQHADVSQAVNTGQECSEILLSRLQEQGAHEAMHGAESIEGEQGPSQPCMEGRRDDLQEEGQLQERALSAGTGLAQADGSQGRLPDGAPAGDGGMVRLPADTDGSCAPRRPRSAEKRSPKSGPLAGQQQSQAVGAWPVCGRCALPMVTKGLGTALKPAHEPICVARKPLVGTVAANVLAHGTGAINIDACRVAGESTIREVKADTNGRENWRMGAQDGTHGSDAGRWPANIIHDGSDEVVALFPREAGQSGALKTRNSDKTRNAFGAFAGSEDANFVPHDERGSAARFFYCAKASRADRNAGLEVDLKPVLTKGGTLREWENALRDGKVPGNTHPTVKPTDLMAYLVRLVTPPGGLVLDPFMGSGSTGKACMREEMRFIGIDMSAEYVEIARARIEHELARVIAANTPPPPPPQMDMFAALTESTYAA